ncbi:MAG: hypothetical protein ACHREM_18020 [Polyangiales bacterium]
MTQQEHPNLPSGQPHRPSLEAHNPSMDQPNQPAPGINYQARDLRFVLDVYTACLAETAAKGGDTKYAAQNSMIIARQALGVLVALGLIEAETATEDGTPLWLSPAVPPMGQAPQRATL